MSFQIIEADSVTISHAIKLFSPTYKLMPLDILVMISSSKEKLVERFFRDGEATVKEFLYILKRVLPKPLKAGTIKKALMNGESSKSFFPFQDKGYGLLVVLTQIGKQICEAFRSGVDLIILRPKSGAPDRLMPEVLIRKEGRKILYNSLLNGVSEHMFETILSAGPWQYDNPESGLDTVTHIISKHIVNVSLLTQIGKKKDNIRSVSYFSKVLQARPLQRFPKAREGFDGLTCEILVDNNKIENEQVTKSNNKLEVLEANTMTPGKWYNYGMIFTGKYPIIQHNNYYLMCIDYFLGTDGTTITFHSDSPLIRDSLHIVIAHFDRARSIYSFEKHYPRIEKMVEYNNGIVEKNAYIDFARAREVNQQSDEITFDLMPKYRQSVEWNTKVSTVIKQSRVNHEFIFVKYKTDESNLPMTVQKVEGNQCCNLGGLNCRDCMTSVGLITV